MKKRKMKKHFIKASEDFCSVEHPVAAPLLRKSFVLEAKPESAEIWICGLGFYVLTVNGTDITKGHIAPYISNPDDICYYDVYDVAEYLREGENIIGAVLGNGFINCFGGAIWDFDKADFRGAPRLALEFKASVGGEEIFFEADRSFRTHSSPILFDDLRLGETYDASLEIKDWDKAGFDDSSWGYAIPAETPRGEMRKCTAEPIGVMEELAPVSIVKQGDAYLYDFGINTAGVCRLRINAQKGQKITMWHGELLVDGKFYNENICFRRPTSEYYYEYNQTERYIASGEGEEVYVPKFAYYGFRYVLVEGITEEQATKDLLTYIRMSSDIRTIGGFNCSNERVNKLYSMMVNADRSNFFYFPTDCPHREKNGWTGDASMSADHFVLMYDIEASIMQWLDNIRKAQDDRGALPGIVPTAGWGFGWGNGPTWDSVLFNMPYVLYKFRGNTEVIKQNSHAMLRYLAYALTRRSENGTIAIGLGDWVPVGKKPDGYKVPLAFTDSVMVMDMARKACEMFTAVGDVHSAEYARGIYTDMRDTVRRELIDLDTCTVKGDSQSGQCIGLYYGVFEEDEKPRAFERLLDFIHENNGAYDCGFIGLHCIFHILSEFGKTELAYKMIMGGEYPSYAYYLDSGVTAMVEQMYPELTECGSLNHHFLGDISRWFTVALAGLKVIDSETVEIAPAPVSELDFAQAWYELPSGRVSVRWERDTNGGIRVSYSAPDGVKVIEKY